MFCAACILQFASEARAQCAARDVLQNQLKLKKAPSASAPPVLVRSATDVLVFVDSFALRNALDAKWCNIGGLAAEIVVRPAFVIPIRSREYV